MIKVFLDTSPLTTGHAHRGIGRYTSSLASALQKRNDIQLIEKPEHADLIHYPYFDLFRATLPLFTSSKSVVTIHDVIPLQFPKYYRPGIRGSVKLFRQKLALKQVSAVITDSIASKKEISRFLGYDSSLIFPIHLAASSQIQYQSKEKQLQVRKKHQLPKTFILYVGDINYNKNLSMLIAAAAKLATPLVMVGKNIKPQPIAEWSRIENTIKTHKLKDEQDIFITTSVDTASDLAAIYSAATVYVQPSLAEGFGLPILEAMACKTPVVCFDQSSMKEIADNHAFYPSSVSIEALAESIQEVMNLRKEIRKQVTDAAFTYSTSFSWEKVAKETVKVYKRVLS